MNSYIYEYFIKHTGDDTQATCTWDEIKETNKRDLQKRPTKETYKETFQYIIKHTGDDT